MTGYTAESSERRLTLQLKSTAVLQQEEANRRAEEERTGWMFHERNQVKAVRKVLFMNGVGKIILCGMQSTLPGAVGCFTYGPW